MRSSLVTLCVAVLALGQASAAVVINEIHYNPDVKTEPAEFLELYNAGTNAVNLAGWYFSDGLNYTFSSVTIAAGGYRVLAQNPAFIQTKFGLAGALGPFNADGSSGLWSRGEKLTLRNAAGQVEDEVEYQLGFPWPTVGDAVTPGNGNSIELIHPSLDNDLGGSWRSSLRGGGANGPTPGRTNTVYATNAPPQTRQVEHTPNEPTSGQSVNITAKVTDPNGVASVTLQYQIVSPGAYIELNDSAYTNAANWITLAMNDSGTNGDAAAGDDTYTAPIPASVQTNRRLIRYRITVADPLGVSVRVPYADDPQPNFAYFVYNGVPGWQGAVQPGAGGANGTVINYSSNVVGRLPVYHLIARSNTAATATWFSRYLGDLYQWGGTLVYDGKVYDHIRYRARGGVWRYSMVKNMWKFDMNRGHDFEPRDNWGRKFETPWTKVNLGASIQQGDFNHRGEQGMFESVGFRLFNLAGVAAPHTTFVTFRVIDDAQEASPTTQFEGDFWGAYLAIEQEDGRFLEEHGLPDGNLYKMESGTGELNNTGPNGPINKSDLTYLQANYTGASEQWWRTNWNVASHYSYQAIVQGIHHYDIADGKNYFFYKNPETRLWETCTWDLDLIWADNMYRSGQTGGGEPLKSRLLDDFNNPGRLPVINIEFRNRVREIRDLLWNSDQVFKLIDEYAALLRGPTNGPTILDADRSMWDYNPKMLSSTYTPNLGKAGQGRFYQWPNQTPNPAGLPKTFDGGLQLMKSYVGYRSTNATFSLDTIATDNAKPARPTITYTAPSGYPINRLTFRSANYSGTNPFRSIRWRIAEITDTNSPNYRLDEPHKYEIETLWDSGPITTFNADIGIPANVLRAGSRYRVRVLHTDTTGRNSQWSLPQEFTVGPPENEADLLNYLRITELMFNPPPGGYEYVELYNSSSTVTLDLAGVKFTQGIDYTFLPGTTLPPGSYLVLVGTTNIAAVRAYYGLSGSVAVVGAYSGALNNAGEQLVLRTSAGGTDIVNFNYGDGRGWPPQTDGAGHSLVLLDSALGAQGSGAGEYAGNWRASTTLRGSPGSADAVPVTTIVLNEVVAHTDYTNELTSNDWIEIHNPSDAAFVFGQGWYLSDDAAILTKWQIPATNFIQPRGFITFDEISGFHNPTNIGFGLDKGGEQVFLSFLPGNAQDRIVDALSFKAQENDWSVGRYPDGGPFWYALTPRTRGTANAAPLARVAISEVLFHPPDVLVGTNLTDNSLDEFIEIHNATPVPVTLHNTNGTWRLNGGVDFVFPTNITLAADAYLLIINFNPATNAAQLAAFKSTYGITDPGLVILGPYLGKLANNSDRLALEKPQHPDGTNSLVDWVIIDEVLYADQAPWPCGSDGSGNSLQRLNDLSHGSDPTVWSAEPPTAGRVRANLPPGLPTITTAPQDRIVATNANASFSVSVCGTPPFTYQWQRNSNNIAGGTNATHLLFNVTPASAGLYRVIVANQAGAVTSESASLIVQFPPVITAQPQPATVIRDQGTNFSVTVGGTPPFGYQWRLNGANIAGATNTVLTLSNIQSNQAGAYSVLVFNTAGSVLSSSAILAVRIPATIIQPPNSQTQRVTINPNGFFYNPTNVTMSVGAIGSGTLRYQWRFFGTNLLVATATNSSLIISNVTLASEGAYTVVVTDDIGSATSPAAILTVLVPPVIMVQPVGVTNLQWRTATFSVIATGGPPLNYRWLRQGVNYLSNAPATLVITNLQPGIAGSFRVTITNLAGNVNSTTVTLGVIPDTDADGLPDFWETNYVGNATNMSATADPDGDGMINRDEYVAGTDPTNALSVLKLTLTTTNTGLLQFVAQTNVGYTVQYRTNLNSAVWNNITSISAQSLMQTVQVNVPNPPLESARFYRIVTPPVP